MFPSVFLAYKFSLNAIVLIEATIRMYTFFFIY